MQTVTTVDYGDLVLTSTAGQLIAALVMIGGIGFLTVITAVIHSTFIENTRSRLDGHQICARLDVIEGALTNVRARDRDVRH